MKINIPTAIIVGAIIISIAIYLSITADYRRDLNTGIAMNQNSDQSKQQRKEMCKDILYIQGRS